MQKQVVALLLCSLLASTFAHEYLHAKAVHQHQAKLVDHEHEQEHHHSKHHEHLEHHSKHHALTEFSRAAGLTQQCWLNCTGSGGITVPSNGLQLYINASINLIGVVNVTANVAVIFDIGAQLIGFFNGNNGTVLVGNISSPGGVYIAGGKNLNIGWYVSQQDFATFFASLNGLTVYLTASGAVKFDANTSSSAILSDALAIIIWLDISIKLAALTTVAGLIQFVISSYGPLFQLLNGVLKGLLQFATGAVISLAGDLKWLVQLLIGVGQVIGKVAGGLTGLIAQGLQLDLQILCGTLSGIVVLANLLLSLGAVISLSVLGGLITNLSNLLQLIVQLGGGLIRGLTGIIKFVLSLVLYINGKLDLAGLIQVLLQVSASLTGGLDITLSVALGGLIDAIGNLLGGSVNSNCTELQTLQTLTLQLQNGTLSINGVNVTSIVGILENTVSQGIGLVISVLVGLQNVIKLSDSIPALITNILNLLVNTTAGAVTIVGNLFKDLGADLSQNLIPFIVKSTNIPKIIAAWPSIPKILAALPIVGPIYTQISAALKAATNGTINLDTLLGGSGIVASVGAWLKVVFGASITGSISWSG